MNLKGRENEFRNIAIELIKRFQNDVGEVTLLFISYYEYAPCESWEQDSILYVSYHERVILLYVIIYNVLLVHCCIFVLVTSNYYSVNSISGFLAPGEISCN